MQLEAFGKTFELVNEEKFTRAVEGTLSREAKHVGGVGEDAEPEKKIAEYDRLGGLIRLDGSIVKKGSFWDFKKKAAVKDPVVTLQFSINGKQVEVPADEPLPAEVRAAKAAEQGEEADETPKRKRGKGGTLIGSKKGSEEGEE